MATHAAFRNEIGDLRAVLIWWGWDGKTSNNDGLAINIWIAGCRGLFAGVSYDPSSHKQSLYVYIV